jgi:hypothetical protein
MISTGQSTWGFGGSTGIMAERDIQTPGPQTTIVQRQIGKMGGKLK